MFSVVQFFKKSSRRIRDFLRPSIIDADVASSSFSYPSLSLVLSSCNYRTLVRIRCVSRSFSNIVSRYCSGVSLFTLLEEETSCFLVHQFQPRLLSLFVSLEQLVLNLSPKVSIETLFSLLIPLIPETTHIVSNIPISQCFQFSHRCVNIYISLAYTTQIHQLLDHQTCATFSIDHFDGPDVAKKIAKYLHNGIKDLTIRISASRYDSLEYILDTDRIRKFEYGDVLYREVSSVEGLAVSTFACSVLPQSLSTYSLFTNGTIKHLNCAVSAAQFGVISRVNDLVSAKIKLSDEGVALLNFLEPSGLSALEKLTLDISSVRVFNVFFIRHCLRLSFFSIMGNGSLRFLPPSFGIKGHNERFSDRDATFIDSVDTWPLLSFIKITEVYQLKFSCILKLLCQQRYANIELAVAVVFLDIVPPHTLSYRTVLGSFRKLQCCHYSKCICKSCYESLTNVLPNVILQSDRLTLDMFDKSDYSICHFPQTVTLRTLPNKRGQSVEFCNVLMNHFEVKVVEFFAVSLPSNFPYIPSSVSKIVFSQCNYIHKFAFNCLPTTVDALVLDSCEGYFDRVLKKLAKLTFLESVELSECILHTSIPKIYVPFKFSMNNCRRPHVYHDDDDDW
ncbi:hypothetical protein RCL1_002385 [Eukaryota sp. TZLM3-RCL]